MPERHLDDDEEWESKRHGPNMRSRRDKLTEMIRKYQNRKSTGPALIINKEAQKQHREDIKNMLARRGFYIDDDGNLRKIEE
jgi:hypothetical protein